LSYTYSVHNLPSAILCGTDLTITGTTIHGYDKNGITAIGSGTTLVAENNTVTGAGPTGVLAQNGIEIAEGAKGTVVGNVVVANDYKHASSAATSILFYQSSDGGQANDNTVSETNNAIYFYFSNKGTANGNSVSKVANSDAPR
jgi:hypothetical protein